MASSVGSVKLGSQGLEVSPLGLGCMGMSMMYGNPPSEEDSINLIHHAIHSGITFFDSSDVYGPHTNEILIGKAIQGMREKVQLATKFGIVVDKTSGYEFTVRGDPKYVRSCCEASLKRLGVDYIDLYYQHRVDTNVPIEVTVGAMKKLVEEGKVKYIGLSEASASTIRRAHAVHPISAVQIEWSLWSRDVEQDIIPTCKELGIGIVPYSPLGRGFLSLGRKIMEGASDKDYRTDYQPRLAGDNLDHNEALFQKFSRFASKKGCTPGQLALAWVRHQGIDCVVPIPGTTKVKNLDENVGTLSVKLSKEELQEIEILFPHESVAGSRYSQEEKLTFLNSETPPLSTWQGDS